jgi:hypothetical protein
MKLTAADLVPALPRASLPLPMEQALAYTLLAKKKGKRFVVLTRRLLGIADLPSETWGGMLPPQSVAEDEASAAVQALNVDYPKGRPYNIVALRRLAWACTTLARVLDEDYATRADPPQPSLQTYQTLTPAVADVCGLENPIDSPTGRNALYGDLLNYINAKEQQA